MNYLTKCLCILVVVAVVFTLGLSETPATCSIVQGLPGLNGRDGRDGAIGPKGDPVLLFDGGKKVGGKVFVTIGQKENHTTAQNICKEVGGSLSTPRNEEENSVLLEIMNTKGGSSKAFLGISDSQVEGTFKNFTGENVSFTNWSPGQPDDYNNNEDCVEMYSNGKWNDIPCSLEHLVICEFQ